MLQNRDTPIRILIYRTGGIGDVILSTVSLDIIFNWGRPVQVYWVGFHLTSDLIQQAYPQVKSIIISRENSYRENWAAILSQIDGLDIILDLQKSPRSIVLCWQVARKHRASYHTWNKGSFRRSKLVVRARVSGRNGRFRKSSVIDAKPRNKLMAACVLHALSSFSSHPNFSYSPRLPIGKIRSKPLALTENMLWIGVAAGGLHQAKWAPSHLIVSILEKVREAIDGPLGLAFFGDQYDIPPSEKVMAMLSGKFEARNHCHTKTLTDTARLLGNCDVALCNDTALAHMAEALGLNVAMLFGPTVEAFGYSPFRASSQAFSAHLSCRPCTKDGNISCRYGDKLCFEGIDPDQVAHFLIQNLKQSALEEA